VLERRDVRGGEARAPEGHREAVVPARRRGAAAELEGERAARHHPADPVELEDGRGGGGRGDRLPRFPRQDGDVVGLPPGAQESPDRRLGPARRVEESDEQDLGRALQGAHDSLSATKK
jgi:hypothetical protein